MARTPSSTIREALDMHIMNPSVSVPVPIHMSPHEQWMVQQMANIAPPPESMYLSWSDVSFLQHLKTSGITHNHRDVFQYLFTRWESIVDVLITRGTIAVERYRDLIATLRFEASHTVVAISRADIQTSTQAAMSETLAERLATNLRETKTTLFKKEQTEQTLRALQETRCISKTPLFLSWDQEDVHAEGHTLLELWPDLFTEETHAYSLDDRKAFIGRASRAGTRWNQSDLEALTRHAALAIPSMWTSGDITSRHIVNRPGWTPSSVGVTRYRVGLLLAALDSIATRIFDNINEYSAWTSSVYGQVIHSAWVPPAPPVADHHRINRDVINAEPIEISSPVDPEDVDPVTLEPFKPGDTVYKMRCCGNKLLEYSVEGILRSERTPRCPMCRSNLLV